jgi:hypothetical protein
MTSLAFGRPRALPRESSVPLPELIDDKYLSETIEAKQPSGIPSSLTYFVYAMKLLDIMDKFYAIENSNNLGSRSWSGQHLGATIDIISHLDRFLTTLPSYLKVARPFAQPISENKTCFQLQAKTLHGR